MSSASFSITSFEKTKRKRDESSRLQRKGNGHLFFGNIHVAARKLSEQINYKILVVVSTLVVSLHGIQID